MHGPGVSGKDTLDIDLISASPVALPSVDAVRLERAVNSLRRRWPEFSASTQLPRWQRSLPATVLITTAATLWSAPQAGLLIATVVLALSFSMIGLVRLLAIYNLQVSPTYRRTHPDPFCDADCVSECNLGLDEPSYTILVPLYRESGVAANIVAALGAIDYPPDRLEIFFLTEIDDHATRAALLAAKLTPVMRVITVPAGEPRTKPRALNFGLQMARGDLICIFDAEDMPRRDQLRVAAKAFGTGSRELACVQAPLAIYNASATHWSCQFAIEYAALFEAVLPALSRFKLPLPLAGTSNHFRADALRAVGAWDPFNVTEDADLGYRLARFGYTIAIIAPTTVEEAPETWRVWSNQRRRWLKGWMQTYLVHMRSPAMLWRELGPVGFVAFQVMLGGMILSALVHPWFYVWLVVTGMTGSLTWWAGHPGLVTLIAFNILVGYGAGIALAVMSLRRRGLGHLAAHTILIPVYWLAISAAAYMAIIDFVKRPYHWHKTPHGTSRVTLPVNPA